VVDVDAGEERKVGCAVLVITDGTPDSAEKVERVIIDATKAMRQDADLSISFIQVHNFVP
jgi:hypothetical protein